MTLLTVPEKTSYRATSTHAEVMGYIEELKDLRSPLLHVTDFGKSTQGRELPLLVLSSEGVRDPASARALGRPVVLIQCCIHAGEVEGKESALMLVRDMLGGKDTELLKDLTVLVVPIFNPDGNDAMDTSNRALQIERLQGQDGPPRAGTRINAAGINLNRDYMRHEGVEMRLLQTRVCQPWEPDLSVDTHATNGSVHRFDMTFDVPHTVESGRREPIEFMRSILLPDVVRAVRSGHGYESGWYGNFVEDERVLDAGAEADPSSPVGEGWMTYPHHPRFGGNYRGLTSRMDVLLECYSYLPYRERIGATYAWLIELLRASSTHKDRIRGVIQECRTPPQRVAVQYDLGLMDEPMHVLTRSPRTREGEPVELDVPYMARFVGTAMVDRPKAYLVPERLAPFFTGHGLKVEAAPRALRFEAATLEGTQRIAGRAILEASGVDNREVSWSEESGPPPAGSVLVSTDQPLGAIAVYLCEPESDDGLVQNELLPMPQAGQRFDVLRVLQD